MAGRIAVFIGQITQEYQSEMLRTVVGTAKELDYRLDIFSEFGSYGDNYLHAEGERNIINLPYIEDYDGIIVAPDTFGIKEMEKRLDILLLGRTMSAPVVSIRQEKDCFYNVQIDNRASMTTLVEHFVTEHGLERICFMQGRSDLKDAQERYRGYLDVMEKYHLPVTEHMVFEGNYWRDKGNEAVEWFLGGEEMPQAIVCANDFMAISVIDALRQRGIRVPEEIAVAGFDDVEESRYVDPGLCSMHMPCSAMGEEAVRLIDRIVKGGKSEQIVRLPVETAYRRSCGCGEDEHGHWAGKLYREKLYLGHVLVQNGFMNADYDSCDNMDELLGIAYQYSANFSYTAIYFCMCEQVNENGEKITDSSQYTDYMILRASMTKKDGLVHRKERFLRRELLPKQYQVPGQAVYYFPLHHKNRCLGYLAAVMEKYDDLKDFFQCWVRECCSCMDKVLLYEENMSLQEFRKLSTVDDLTGLYNRRKLEQELSKMMVPMKVRKVEFFIVSLDMDGLKMINDTYGHQEGDSALCAYASIIKASAGEKGLCCRVGGDEFSILVPTGSEDEVKTILERIENGVATYNKISGKPYQLGGSMGYAEFKPEEELTNCLRRADINMYANKMARKKGRI